MKKVSIQVPEPGKYSCLRELVSEHPYVGFECNRRYVFIRIGMGQGVLANADGAFAKTEDRVSVNDSHGDFYSFESAKELYTWMADDRKGEAA